MKILTRVPITYEAIDGSTQHAPLVIASLGHIETRLVLDTGSEVHLLNEDVADALGLEKVPGEEGTDHSGATMPSWNVGIAPLLLGELQVELGDVVAIPAPPPFPGWGIGGILSPQNLHPTAATVINLLDNELLLVEGSDEELAGFLVDRTPGLELLRLARDQQFPSVVVQAAIDGYSEIPTMLNTGGKQTEASAAALPGLAPQASERLGGGVGGSDYAGSLLGPQTLVSAGQRVPIHNLAMRTSMHDPQCLVGMDVLRDTILSCSADLRRAVFWQVRS